MKCNINRREGTYTSTFFSDISESIEYNLCSNYSECEDNGFLESSEICNVSISSIGVNFIENNIFEKNEENLLILKQKIFTENNIFEKKKKFDKKEVDKLYSTSYILFGENDKNKASDTSNTHVNISFNSSDILEKSYSNGSTTNTLSLYQHSNNTPLLPLSETTLKNDPPERCYLNMLITNTPLLSLKYIFFTLFYNNTLLSDVDNILKLKKNQNNNFIKNKIQPKKSLKMIETSSPVNIKRKKNVLSEKVLNLRPFTYHWSNSYKNVRKSNLRIFSAPSVPTISKNLVKETEYFCKNKIDFYSSEIEISSDSIYNDSIVKDKIDFYSGDIETLSNFNYEDSITKTNNLLNIKKKETFFEKKYIDVQSSTSKKKHLIDFWSLQETGEKHSLPTLGPGKCDSIQRISTEVVRKCLECKYNIKYKIIDCRFTYEYRGGHIQGAINANTTKQVDSLFSKYQGHILIFHCEYSSIRAPRLAKYLRNKDREVNKYPKLFFPEIYIVEGGYKNFYWNYKDYCEPKMYVPMCGNRVYNRMKGERNKMGSE